MAIYHQKSEHFTRNTRTTANKNLQKAV